MKKTLIIALSCLAILFAACKKPVEPTPVDPTPVDYTANYVGNYVGQFTLTITSMNNQPQTGMSFPIDSIRMEIAKVEKINEFIATVTIDNEAYQAKGTTSEKKAVFEPIHLILNKPDFSIICDLNLEGKPIENDTLSLNGNFSGKGSAIIMGQEQNFDEVSGTVEGSIGKQ